MSDSSPQSVEFWTDRLKQQEAITDKIAAERDALLRLLRQARRHVWWNGMLKGMHVGDRPNNRLANDRLCAEIDAAIDATKP